jgi:phosphoribosylanthranilate isomerase
MKIKVCGLKYPGNIEAVSALNPDYMGFIFYEKTPRFADGLSVEILNNIPAATIRTAVFVNESAETIDCLVNKYGFEAIQLHGNESAAFCADFKGRVKVIKAFGLNEDFDFSILNEYVKSVDFFLFDTKTPIYGGSGKTFNWDILNNYDLDIPFFLSGGLSLDNLEEIKNINHPRFYGVDLNSRFETAPGMKDIDKLEKAFDIIKQTTYK